MQTLRIWIYGYARYWGRPLERGDLGLDLAEELELQDASIFEV